ncbi:2-hydroxycarboxylate transporter family protein [Saccharopolyspora sp. NPDC050642]|uniref:2-hydroxycarboxylate transporter family protein n=1 Tax=Saccharopolyspora sp. NPDC050642 TaxID=3157099 RepID=UPI003403D25C
MSTSAEVATSRTTGRGRSWNPLKATVGDVPLVVPVLLVALVVVAGVFGRIPENMIGGLAVITGFGMLLGPLGNRLPVVSKIGGGALLCLMVPSVLVHFGAFNETILNATAALMKEANFLYFVISALVVGSILGMRRSTMLKALVKIFPPLVVGTAVAVAAGLGVAVLSGYPLREAFFFIVVPIIGGGIGEGVIPLSAAYAHALGGEQADFVARLIPAAVIGNIVAIISAGLLRRLGDRRPHLDGGGDLVKQKRHEAEEEVEPGQDAAANHGIGVLVICGLFVAGYLAEPVLHLPAPVLVIVFSVICKLLNVFPDSVEHGARACYGIVSGHFIYPVMIGLGMLYVPLTSVFGVISVGFVVTCAAVVLTMAASGFLVGKWLGMYPVDASLVTVCHSGLGGTGDVAILSASNRMVLMPFAQISTRIGGVVTVIGAAALIQAFG